MDGYTIKDGQVSYSSGSKYHECPKAYKYRYIDKVRRIHAPDPTDPLILGNALHTGMQYDYEAAEAFYLKQFNVMDDIQVNELIKIEHWVTRGMNYLLELDILHREYEINTDDYKGTIDLIVDNNDGTVDIIDYKYCAESTIVRYLKSEQLHIYKYFLGETTDYKVRDLRYVIFPKLFTRQKDGESLSAFRQRVQVDLSNMNFQILRMDYVPEMLGLFGNKVKKLKNDTEFKPNRGEHCKKCVYRRICNGKDDYNMLPSSDRRDITKISKKKIWIYGPPFSGKTTMLDDAPNPLNLNTDGNINFVTMAYVPIKDMVTTTGRLTERKYAWDVLKESVTELEGGKNDFKTIIVDLLEDTREMCRVKMYADLGIQHESDSGYGKGWDIIKTEYLSLIKRIFNLDYENIVVLSHEDISKDITKKNGQNITKIAPNIQSAIANKVAGMVDIVARIIVDDDGTRTLNFKANEVIFGGGRLKGLKTDVIDLKWSELMKVYEGIEVDAPVKKTKAGRKSKKTEAPKVEKVADADVYEESRAEAASANGVQATETVPEEPKADKPETRKSRKKKADEKHEEEHPTPTIDGIPIDTVMSVLEKDVKERYVYHDESDDYFILAPGEVLPESADAAMCEIVSKEQYDEAKAEEQKRDEATNTPSEPKTEKTEEPKTDAAPRRRRRRS